MQSIQQHKFPKSTQKNARSSGKKGMYLPDNRQENKPVQRKAGNGRKSKVNINDSHSLEKEADVMGAKALQKKPDASSAERTVQKKSIAGFGSSEVVQRFAVVPNLGGITLTIHEQDKWNKVVQDLTAFGVLKNIPGMNVNLNLVHTGGTNPASTNTAGGDINISLEDWFLDQSSAAETVALITHELGAHNLSNVDLGMGGRMRENQEARVATNIVVGPHNLTLTPTRALLPPHGDISGRRQEDHVNVGKDTGAHVLPMVPGAPIPVGVGLSQRGSRYTETMLAQGEAIWNRGGAPGPSKEKIADLKHLLETYLFDVARIMATDDGQALQVLTSSRVIADVMNWYRNIIVQRYVNTYPWLNDPGLQVNKSGWNVAGMLIGKVGAYMGARIGTSRAGRTRVGRMLRPVVGGVGNVIGGTVRGTTTALKGTGRGLITAVKGAGRGVTTAVKGTVSGVQDIAQGNKLRGTGKILGGLALGTAQTVGGVVHGGVQALGGVLHGTGQVGMGVLRGTGRILGDTARGIWSMFG